ncbi:MAG: ferredoxin reductase family protein [Actinomycetia bacterium]|jgi:predicted ferric reductase|nr:ferredoxin reductase family protein [Actinomycetes bacterium]
MDSIDRQGRTMDLLISDRREARVTARGQAPAVNRPVPAHRRRALRAADALLLLAGLGLVVTVALAVRSESLGSLTAPGGWATAAGRLTGLVGTYLMLVVLVLVARVPWLERAVGLDRVIAWHRALGPWPIVLVAAHAALLTVGYAAAGDSGVLHQAWVFVTQYPNVLAATVALGLLVLAGLTSWRHVRRRLAYETWWAVHLYTYLAMALAFAHQLTAGAAFVAEPAARLWWSAMWALGVGAVVVFRFGLPLYRSVRHGLRVVAVRPEGPGLVSVVVRGRDLDRLGVRGGQFFQWRFLRRGLWWQAHPYSLSALPRRDHLRVTVKALGDHSAGLAHLPIGTRVAIEGPYGILTDEVRTTDRVLLVGGGVGITPLLALLEDLPDGTDTSVVLRAHTTDDLAHQGEVVAHVERLGGRLHTLVGPRQQAPVDTDTLRRLVPDVAARDVYVCGPQSLIDAVRTAARELGVPDRRVHVESFTF